jgi:KDO2-lipid IV(A) lauroyltransferase
MADGGDAPPLRWLVGSAEQRRRALQYWGTDTAVGAFNSVMHRGLRLLPIDWCSAIGARLGQSSPARYRESDARARQVFIRLRPEASDPAWLDAAMKRLWRNVGRGMAEYSVLDRLWEAGRIDVEGMEHVDAARASGRPTLFACLHLGNWETSARAVIEAGHSLTAYYLPPENRFEHRLIKKVRNRYGVTAIPPGPYNNRGVLRLLKENKQVFMFYIDELIRDRVHAPAFGRKLQPTGNIAYVARLAAMSGAKVVPVYSLRVGDSARFKVRFLPEVEMVETGDRDADTMTNIARLDAVIDPIVRANLDQWYYVLDFEFDK